MCFISDRDGLSLFFDSSVKCMRWAPCSAQEKRVFWWIMERNVAL